MAPVAAQTITFNGDYIPFPITNPLPLLASFTLNSTNSFPLTLAQNIANDDLRAFEERIGTTGQATYAQSDATNYVGTLYLAHDTPTSSGTYKLTGGILTSFDAHVGYAGAGTFTHSAGTHAANYTLNLGTTADSSGSYSLSGTGALTLSSPALDLSGVDRTFLFQAQG